jgi:hypothetical protein
MMIESNNILKKKWFSDLFYNPHLNPLPENGRGNDCETVRSVLPIRKPLWIENTSRRFMMFFLALSFAGKLGAEVSVSASVDKAKIRIGDVVTYVVTIAHDDSVKVLTPGQGANLGGFEIRSYREIKPKKEAGHRIESVEYQISTFTVGEFEIPAYPIIYFSQADTAKRLLATNPIKIVVESMKPSESGDIRDVKPPLPIPYNWKRLVMWIAGGVIIAGVALWLFLRFRKKRSTESGTDGKPLRPPHETAFEALEKLRAEQLIEKGELKAYYTALADIIRIYIEGRYGVPATQLTTTELIRDLRYSAGEHTSRFGSLFEACDLVKFAKHVPSEKDHENAFQYAWALVDETKIVPVIEPVTEPVTEPAEVES